MAMTVRFGLLALALGLIVSSLVSVMAAPEGVIAAPDAQVQAQAGEITIIDVRQPSEWRETGLPGVAVGVSIHDQRQSIRPDFVGDVGSAVGGDKSARIAVICAGGVRSAKAREILVEAGFTQVLDINEGMFGNGEAPGWLARGLPVTPCPDC